jgi:hypothetical protein
MRLFLAASAAILLLASSPEGAEGQDIGHACRFTVEMATADLAAQAVPKAIRSFRGDDAQKIVAAFNALPPESDIEADALTVLYHPTLPIVALLFGRGDCVAALASPWSVQKAEDLIAKALGTAV